MNEDQQIVGVGYNRFPRGCDDDDPDLPWRGGDWNDPKRNKLSYGRMVILCFNSSVYPF